MCQIERDEARNKEQMNRNEKYLSMKNRMIICLKLFFLKRISGRIQLMQWVIVNWRWVMQGRKCREEKTKGEKGKNAAVNLTTENQKEQKACVDMKSNLRNLLNFPKIFYPTIL